MNCPNCSVALVLADRQGVEIDYCPQCRGVWLDRGELDKIIERAASRHEGNRDRDAVWDRDDERRRKGRDDYSDHKHYPKKKRESFLSELFDF